MAIPCQHQGQCLLDHISWTKLILEKLLWAPLLPRARNECLQLAEAWVLNLLLLGARVKLKQPKPLSNFNLLYRRGKHYPNNGSRCPGMGVDISWQNSRTRLFFFTNAPVEHASATYLYTQLPKKIIKLLSCKQMKGISTGACSSYYYYWL